MKTFFLIITLSLSFSACSPKNIAPEKKETDPLADLTYEAFGEIETTPASDLPDEPIKGRQSVSFKYQKKFKSSTDIFCMETTQKQRDKVYADLVIEDAFSIYKCFNNGFLTKKHDFKDIVTSLQTFSRRIESLNKAVKQLSTGLEHDEHSDADGYEDQVVHTEKALVTWKLALEHFSLLLTDDQIKESLRLAAKNSKLKPIVSKILKHRAKATSL